MCAPRRGDQDRLCHCGSPEFVHTMPGTLLPPQKAGGMDSVMRDPVRGGAGVGNKDKPGRLLGRGNTQGQLRRKFIEFIYWGGGFLRGAQGRRHVLVHGVQGSIMCKWGVRSWGGRGGGMQDKQQDRSQARPASASVQACSNHGEEAARR